MTSSITLNGTTGIANATWTTGTRPASPVAGQSGYNTTIGAMETYTGSTWSTSDLPAPSTAGNVLTSNGTSWTSSTPPSTTGGATTSSSAVNITLTSSSNKVQDIIMTASGLSLNLPDATTITTLGGPIFVISNLGAYSFYVKDNTGAIIYNLASGANLILNLTNNSTAAGVWDTNYFPPTITQGVPTTVDASAVTRNNRVDAQNDCYTYPLSSTTAIAIYCKSGSMYGVILTVSGTTVSVGTPVQLYNGATNNANSWVARMLSTTAGILCVDRGTTGSVAVPINISGSTISAGSTLSYATTTTAGQLNITTGLTPMSSTVCLIAYITSAGGTTGGSSSSWVVNTITHNGASAPTLGSTTAMPALYNLGTSEWYATPIVKLTSTTAQIWYLSTTNFYIYTRVITISGTSAPTLGTELTSTSTGLYLLHSYGYSATESAVWDNYTWYSYTISGTTVTLQNTSSQGAQFQPGYVFSPITWFNSTTGLMGAIGTNAPSGFGIGRIYKVSYIPGTNVVPLGYYSNSVVTNSNTGNGGVDSFANLSSTTGIMISTNSLYILSASAFTLV